MPNQKGWTSTGLSDKASTLLDEMSDDLGMNKREVCSLCIEWFHESTAFTEVKDEMAALLVLKEKYPTLVRMLAKGA